MEDAARSEIAELLENLADLQTWNSDVWKRCYEFVSAGAKNNELAGWVFDDVIHYSGEFHSRNIFGFRTKPDKDQLDDYRYTFRSIAAALRENLSLAEARKKYDL